MEIQVNTRSKVRKDFISACSKMFADILNLNNSKFSLEIYTVANLRRDENNNGVVTQIGPKKIAMMLDSRLSMARLLYTLAHEMVHVKQIAKGQYRGLRAGNGKVVTVWMGKIVKAEYFDRPWEIEAFKREKRLVEILCKRVNP